MMLTAVLLVLLGLARGSQDVVISRLIKEGDIYFSGGDWTTATARYTDAIGLQESPLLFTKRAAAYINLRQPSHALKDFGRALEMDGTYLQGYMNRGKLERATCSFNAATRDFNKVLELDPESAEAKKELELVEEARKMVEQVQHLEEKPDSSLSTVLEALAPLQQSDLVDDCAIMVMLEAKANFKALDWERVTALTGKVIKADPSHMAALSLRGRAYYYSYEHDLAKLHFGEALKYDPDYKEASEGFKLVKAFERAKTKAEKAQGTGNWAEAEQLYGAALHVDSTHNRANKDLWYGYGTMKFNGGKYDGCVEAFQNVLILDSEHENAKIMLVKALLKQELWEEAVNKARTYQREHQQSGEIRQLLGEAEKRLKMSKRKDYYKILGISRDATDRDIKKAYRDLAKLYHPDKAEGTEAEVKVAEEKFREVAEAVEVLSDEEKRRRFDNGEDIEIPQGHHNPWGNHGGQQFHFRWG